MEIETKYTVPDEDVFSRLCLVAELAGMPLSDPQTARAHDRYIDTRERDFLAAGYFCRVRTKGGKVVATLKSLSPASGALHVREEFETIIEPGTGLQPESWPDGPAADLARRLGQGKPLELLVELFQERQTRSIQARDGDGNPLVEISLDKAVFAGPGEGFYELEAEQRRPGQAAVLARLNEALVAEWGLAPQPLSKFERALQLHRPDVLAAVKKSVP